MTRSRKEELCNHCKYRYQKYTAFDGGAIYLTVDKCRKGHNIHSQDLECEGFRCNLKDKIKNILVRW